MTQIVQDDTDAPEGTEPVMLRRAIVGYGDKDAVVHLSPEEADKLVDGGQADRVELVPLGADATETAGYVPADFADGFKQDSIQFSTGIPEAERPTERSKRDDIDAYAQHVLNLDTTGASSKGDALAMIADAESE